MQLSVAFWVCVLIWLVWGFWSLGPNWKAGAPNLLLFLIICILGWQVFGSAIHK